MVEITIDGHAVSVPEGSTILEAARKISRALTAVLMLVGMIALVISGVGIMNIMLVTVTERTHEIGLRKAVGARRQEILYQFLIEALIISHGHFDHYGGLIGFLDKYRSVLPADITLYAGGEDNFCQRYGGPPGQLAEFGVLDRRKFKCA